LSNDEAKRFIYGLKKPFKINTSMNKYEKVNFFYLDDVELLIITAD